MQSLRLRLAGVFIAVFSILGISLSGCNPDPEVESDPRALAVWDSVEQDGVIYAGGTYRYPANAAGNHNLYGSFLLILDASDPTHPEGIEGRDTKRAEEHTAEL